MRHGVRAPTWTADRLNRYSTAPWPDFRVQPGYLTERGGALLRNLGAYYRARWAADGLLPPAGCAPMPRVYVWADTDQRTLESGRLLASGFAPDCGIAVHSRPPDAGKDPLFDPIAAGLLKPYADRQRDAVRARITPDAATYVGRLAPAFHLLHEILTGGGTAADAPFTLAPTIGVEVTRDAVEITGPLATASTLSENLLLEYANGFTGRELGWERLDAARVRTVLELHAAYADLTRRTAAIARARGSILLDRIRRSIEQAASGKQVEGALGSPDDAALVIVAHDTNQSNLSGMLGFHWTVDGYPDDETPPGGAILFSVWRAAAGAPVVQVSYVAQTPEQMHRAEPLTLDRPPAGQRLALPGCAAGIDCPLSTFLADLKAAVDPTAVR
jgi:4-phytase / acid phosphatase